MYLVLIFYSDLFFFFFSSRRRHTRSTRDWSSDVCSSDLLCSIPAAPIRTPRRSGAAASGPLDRRPANWFRTEGRGWIPTRYRAQRRALRRADTTILQPRRRESSRANRAGGAFVRAAKRASLSTPRVRAALASGLPWFRLEGWPPA